MSTDQLPPPPPAPPSDSDAGPGSGPGSGPGPERGSDLVDRLGRLRRDSGRRWLGGVGAGIARSTDVDVVLVRAVLAVLGVFGVGVVLYVVLWVVMPDDRGREDDRAVLSLGRRSRGTAVAVAAVVAVAWLAALVLGLQDGPLVFAGLVVAAVLWFRERRLDDDSIARRRAPAPSDDATEAYDRGPTAAERRVQRRALRRVRRRARGPVLLWPVLAVASLVVGAMALTVTTGLTDIPVDVHVAVFLLIVAGGLLVGARWGRPRGLGVLGLIASVALVASSITVDATETTVAPTSAAGVPVTETFGTGHLELDLTALTPDELAGRTTTVRADIGLVSVLVPEGTRVVLRGRVDGFGGVGLFDAAADGPDDTDVVIGGVAGTDEATRYDRDDPVPPDAYVLDVALDHGVVDVQAVGR